MWVLVEWALQLPHRPFLRSEKHRPGLARADPSPKAIAPARFLFSSELKAKEKTPNISSVDCKEAVCLVSSGVAQQDFKAGAGRVCLWSLPEAFPITVLSVSVVITFAPDAGEV